MARPHVALKALVLIAECAKLDGAMAILYIAFLGEHAKAGAAEYHSETYRREKAKLFSQAVAACPDMDVRELAVTLSRWCDRIIKQRDRIAHSALGYSDQLPDALLIFPPKELASHAVRSTLTAERFKKRDEAGDSFGFPPFEPWEDRKWDIMVWRAKDFDALIAEARDAYTSLTGLDHAMNMSKVFPSNRAKLYARLMASIPKAAWPS
jgi:hypothetical protein